MTKDAVRYALCYQERMSIEKTNVEYVIAGGISSEKVFDSLNRMIFFKKTPQSL